MKKIIFVSLFSCFFQFVFSQQLVVLNETKPETYIIRYTASGNQYANQIINQLSSKNGKTIHSTNFTYEYQQKILAYKQANRLEISVKLEQIKIKGDTYYRGFSVEEFLFPNLIDFELIVRNKKQQQIRKYIKQNQKISIRNNTSLLINETLTDTLNSQGYEIIVQNKNFVYDWHNAEALKKHINLIDNYYATAQKISNAQTTLSKVNTENIETITQTQNTVKQQRQILQSINIQQFNSLNLKTKDPANLLEKQASFEKSIIENEKKLQNIQANLYKIYYEKGIYYKDRGNLFDAENYFMKSITENNNFAPAHIELAELNYNKQNYAKTVETCQNILQKMYADTYVKERAANLLINVINHHVAMARKYNANGQFNLALDQISMARSICRPMSEIVCGEDIELETQYAINGLWQIHLEKINKELTGNNAEMSEKYFDDAYAFWIQHQFVIETAQKIDQAGINVYFLYIKQGHRLNKNGHYEKAILKFQKAQKFCEKYQQVNCNDEPTKGILTSRQSIYNQLIVSAKASINADNLTSAQQYINNAEAYQNQYNLTKNTEIDHLKAQLVTKQYENTIKQADKYFYQKNYYSAIETYQEAKNLENNRFFRTTKNAKINSKITQSAQNIILDELQKGEDEVKNDNLYAARNYYSNAKAYQQKYQIKNKPAVDAAFSNLKNNIFSKECANLQNQYDAEYQKAIDYIDHKNYIDANKSLEKSINISAQKVECEVSSHEAKQKISEIKNAYLYQIKMAKIQERTKVGDYGKAIDLYRELTTFYEDNNIHFFGIAHQSLFDFIYKQNNYFLNFGALYFIQQENYEHTLKLLRKLENSNFNKKYTKDNQKLLGIRLASRDYKNNPSNNYKANIMNYTAESRWFKYFAKSYKKQWKRLK